MLCISYLLRAEGLSPVVQNEPVFGVWLVFYRGLVSLLSVCDFAIFVHGWYGPPATVGGSNIVGRRHDRGFCACERGAERERGREGGIERERGRDREGWLEGGRKSAGGFQHHEQGHHRHFRAAALLTQRYIYRVRAKYGLEQENCLKKCIIVIFVIICHICYHFGFIHFWREKKV